MVRNRGEGVGLLEDRKSGDGLWSVEIFSQKKYGSFSRNRHHLSSFDGCLYIDWSAAVFAVGNQIKFSIRSVQYDEGVRVAKRAGDGGCGLQKAISLQILILHPSCRRVCGGGRRFRAFRWISLELAGQTHSH